MGWDIRGVTETYGRAARTKKRQVLVSAPTRARSRGSSASLTVDSQSKRLLRVSISRTSPQPTPTDTPISKDRLPKE